MTNWITDWYSLACPRVALGYKEDFSSWRHFDGQARSNPAAAALRGEAHK